MTWLAINWFWVVILVAFMAMHVFGHGSHAGHGGHGGRVVRNGQPQTGEGDRATGSEVRTSAGEHRH